MKLRRLILPASFNYVTEPNVGGIIVSHQRSAWNSSACSVSGGELYLPSIRPEEDRIKDLFYQHQVNAAWINIRSEYGPRWLNGSKYGKIYPTAWVKHVLYYLVILFLKIAKIKDVREICWLLYRLKLWLLRTRNCKN